jgi:hypothetical protein
MLRRVVSLKKDLRTTIIYFRSARTGSTSIIDCIRSSYFIQSFEIKDYDDLMKISNKHKIIIISVAAKPKTALFKDIIDVLNKIENKKSFGVVRNPYSKIISSYKYMKFKEPLKELLLNPPKTGQEYTHFTRTQTEALYLANNLIPDHLLRFENLDEEIHSFFRKYGYRIPRLKKLNTSETKNIKLSKKEVELINMIYHIDFKNFGYEKNIVS